MKIAFAKGDSYDTTLYPTTLSFTEFANLFRKPKVGKKGTVGYFIRGGDMVPSNVGTPQEHFHRNDKSLLSADVLVIDADQGPGDPPLPAPTLQEIHKALKKLNLQHFGYTTSSHTPEKPKCRVIIPCKLKTKGHLVPTMTKLLLELDSLDCKPRAGGSEMYTWSIPWFFATSHPHSDFVLHEDGTDYKAIEPDTAEADTICMSGGARDPRSGMPMSEARKLLFTGESGFHNALHCAAWYFVKTLGEQQAKEELHYLTAYQRVNPVRPKVLEYIKDIPRMVKTAANKTTGPMPFPSLSYHNASDFPKHIFPDQMNVAAEHLSHFYGVSFEFPATFILGMVSAASGRRIKVHEVEGTNDDGVWYHNNLWVTVVLPSGERKSPIVKRLLQPLKKAEKALVNEHKKKNMMAKVNIMANDAAIKKAEKVVQGSPNPNSMVGRQELADLYALREELSKKAYAPQLFTSDATEEAVKKLADRNDGVVALISAEGSSTFRNITNQYGDDPKASTLLCMYSGDEVRVNRVGMDEPILLDDPVLNMCTTIQPDQFTSFISSEGLRSIGLTARMVIVMPRRRVGTRTKDSMAKKYKPELLELYNKLIYNLAANDTEIIIKMSTNANLLYEEYYDKIELSMAVDAVNYRHSDILNKTTSEMVKYAANIQIMKQPEIAENGGLLIITGNTIKMAIRLSDYLLDTKIYSDEQVQSDMQMDKTIACIQSMRRSGSVGMKKMLAEGNFNRGQLIRQVGTTYRDDLEDIINIMVDYGWLIPTGWHYGGPIFSFADTFMTARLRKR